MSPWQAVMPAGPLPCSLIEFYRHINNSQPAEKRRERVWEGQIIDAGVYRWRLLKFHKRMCRGLWGTIAQSTQMEGDARAGPAADMTPSRHTHKNTHYCDSKSVCARRKVLAKYSTQLLTKLPERRVGADQGHNYDLRCRFLTLLNKGCTEYIWKKKLVSFMS